MIGVLIVTHGALADELLAAARIIAAEELPRFRALSLDWQVGLEEARARISEAVTALDDGDGVIVLTDMLGGTPSNLSLSFLQEGKVEVVTGVNLPMLMRLAHLRESKDLKEVASALRQSGQQGITVASEVLHGK